MKTIIQILFILFAFNANAQYQNGLKIDPNQDKNKQYIGMSSNGKQILGKKNRPFGTYETKGSFKSVLLTDFADALANYIDSLGLLASANAIIPSDTAEMLDPYALNSNVVHKTGDETKAGELTLNDSLRVDDYALFMGLNGGLATKIEMLKDGVLQFDHADGLISKYLIKATPLQVGEGGSNFNMVYGTFPNDTYDRDIQTMGLGFNANAGQSLENAANTYLALQWEYFYEPPGSGRLVDEFHLFFTDTNDIAYRPYTVYLDYGDPLLHSTAIQTPTVWFRNATSVYPYFEFTNPSGNRAQMKMLDPVSLKGGNMVVDPGNNLLKFENIGMTDPAVFFSDYDYAVFSAIKRGVSLNTPTKIIGVDGDGWIGDVLLGSALSLSSGTLDVSASGISKWTDGGSTVYPTGSEAVHIPSLLSGSTGALNVIGRIDQAFPSGTYNNIAIGESSGNPSLTGDNNIYLGSAAGAANTTGSYNIFQGFESGNAYTGSTTIAIGLQALKTNVSGAGNIAIGDRALLTTTVGSNLALGNQALQKTSTGAGNMSVGNLSFHENTTGVANTGIGYQTGYSNSAGSENVFIGYQAGLGSDSQQDNNTAIGTYAGYNVAGTGNVFIGYAAGYSETGSGKLYIENSTTATPLIGGDFSANTVTIGGLLTTTGGLIIPTATPASAGATGTTGTIAWDANYIYVCIATNTWKRTAISTW